MYALTVHYVMIVSVADRIHSFKSMIPHSAEKYIANNRSSDEYSEAKKQQDFASIPGEIALPQIAIMRSGV
jgi:hypothetical protein